MSLKQKRRIPLFDRNSQVVVKDEAVVFTEQGMAGQQNRVRRLPNPTFSSFTLWRRLVWCVRWAILCWWCLCMSTLEVFPGSGVGI
jgi:hypothetical protein